MKTYFLLSIFLCSTTVFADINIDAGYWWPSSEHLNSLSERQKEKTIKSLEALYPDKNHSALMDVISLNGCIDSVYEEHVENVKFSHSKKYCEGKVDCITSSVKDFIINTSIGLKADWKMYSSCIQEADKLSESLDDLGFESDAEKSLIYYYE